MPNHVTTRCTVVGPDDEIARFRSRMFVPKNNEHDGDSIDFDFGAVIPMPEALQGVEESGTSEYAARLIILRGERGAPFEKMGIYDTHIERIRKDAGLRFDAPMHKVAATYLANHPDEEAQGRKRLIAILETGYASWYPWCIKNWGTKWGAYSYRPVRDVPFEFLFETAWNFPTPVFEALAREFPALSFQCLTFDEGWNFAGTGFFNPPAGEQPFATCDATDELYERVYGEKPEHEDEDAA